MDNLSAEVKIYDDMGHSITITPSSNNAWYPDYNQAVQ
jgi:hypothetical protein